MWLVEPTQLALLMTLSSALESFLTCTHALISILLNTQGRHSTGFQSSLPAQFSSLQYSVWELQVSWFPWTLNLVSSTQGLHSIEPVIPLLTVQLETQSHPQAELFARIALFVFSLPEVTTFCLMPSVLQITFSYMLLIGCFMQERKFSPCY